MTNPLKALSSLGQSPWLDFMRRTLIGPELDKLLQEDGVGGITSNPSIFEKAIGHSADYDSQFAELMEEGDRSPVELYEALAIKDIQLAADRLSPHFERTKYRDGFVSLEVSPYLALDTDGTIAEARRLWKQVDRPNLMVKVPGTAAGIPAMETLIAEGINVNVTLLFSEDVYIAVAEAYIRGVARLTQAGGNPAKVASVASFFISRIDSVIDGELDKRLKADLNPRDRTHLENLKGKIAIANGKLAYQDYKRLFNSPQWVELAAKGAQPQRLLWASTGTKNPAYPETLYVDTLIGPDTVNTMPPGTMDAFRQKGTAKITIEDDIEGAKAIMAALSPLGISMKTVTDNLVTDGVKLFADANDKLLEAVEGKRLQFLGDRAVTTALALPEPLKSDVDREIEAWRAGGKIRRLWAKDSSLWTGADEHDWLGWLDIVPRVQKQFSDLQDLATEAAKYHHVLLLGMGGSSLGPEVFAKTYGAQKGHPRLLVLDSTDPAQISAFEAQIDLANTLFIVSSKSGSTTEPNILKDHFFQRASEALGAAEAGKRFVAITDPGSQMQDAAASAGFGHVFMGDPQIGGRYSVLSPFGLVPAAVSGVDLRRFLSATMIGVRSAGPDVPAPVNPGVILGVALGVAAKQGRDKLTLVSGPGLEDFGAWAEQLVAESTGKQGHGIIPVDGETLGKPELYYNDRIFVQLSLAGEKNPDDLKLQAIEDAGHPVIRITLTDRYQLGQEFFRWEMAIAVAGAVIGIHPFDQPDVEASKNATRKLTAAVEESGSLPAETPFFEADGIKLFADEANAIALRAAASTKSLATLLHAQLSRIESHDYAAILAYIPRDESTIAALQKLRLMIRNAKKVATCVGFGPRFLHSTGQAYKGGPNSGVFFQITSDHPQDLPVVGRKYSFGTVEAAQARGDFDVLAERRRRALRIHLGADVAGGLEQLTALIKGALA